MIVERHIETVRWRVRGVRAARGVISAHIDGAGIPVSSGAASVPLR